MVLVKLGSSMPNSSNRTIFIILKKKNTPKLQTDQRCQHKTIYNKLDKKENGAHPGTPWHRKRFSEQKTVITGMGLYTIEILLYKVHHHSDKVAAYSMGKHFVNYKSDRGLVPKIKKKKRT